MRVSAVSSEARSRSWTTGTLTVARSASRAEVNRGGFVYLSVVPEHEGRFDLAFELPPQPNSDLPFQEAGWRRGLVLSEVAGVVASHLGLS